MTPSAMGLPFVSSVGVFLAVMGFCAPAMAAIQSSGSLMLVGRVHEVARAELTGAAQLMDLTAHSSVEGAPIGRLSFLSNTDVGPLAFDVVESSVVQEVFSSAPRVFTEDCAPSREVGEGCLIKASWRTANAVRNGLYPVWVRVTIAAL